MSQIVAYSIKVWSVVKQLQEKGFLELTSL